MKTYKVVLLFTGLFGVMSCTSLSEGSPAGELITEPETRVRVDENQTASIRDRMDEQASDINRKKNIEESTINNPAMTPPDLRPQQVEHAPIDSAVHNNVDWLRPARFKNRLVITR